MYVHTHTHTHIYIGLPSGSDGKASASSAGNTSSIPGLGRSPGEENGNPLQYPCLENLMDRGAWWATVHGVAKSQTWLHFHFHIYLYILYIHTYIILSLLGTLKEIERAQEMKKNKQWNYKDTIVQKETSRKSWRLWVTYGSVTSHHKTWCHKRTISIY